MKTLITALIALLPAGIAHAACTDQVLKPEKPKQVARLDWKVGDRTWQVALSWRTKSVGDNGEEEATVVLFVRDNLKRPKLGSSELYRLMPNRCSKAILPQLSTVKLMGRDFLLVTVPDTQHQTGLGVLTVNALMYSIDDKGHLQQVFEGDYEGNFTRGSECLPLVRSFIRPENADGSRFAWVYEYPDVEWVRKKSDCAKAERRQVFSIYEWKNGCFPVATLPDPNHDRLITDWDEEMCVTGKGRIRKPAPAPIAPAPGASTPPPPTPPTARAPDMGR